MYLRNFAGIVLAILFVLAISSTAKAHCINVNDDYVIYPDGSRHDIEVLCDEE
jgi:hypothetical protein